MRGGPGEGGSGATPTEATLAPSGYKEGRPEAAGPQGDALLHALGRFSTCYQQLALGVGWVAARTSRLPMAPRIKSKFLRSFPLFPLPSRGPGLTGQLILLALELGCAFKTLGLCTCYSPSWNAFFLLKPWQILHPSSHAISKIPRLSSDTIMSSLDPCPDWLHPGTLSSFVATQL